MLPTFRILFALQLIVDTAGYNAQSVMLDMLDVVAKGIPLRSSSPPPPGALSVVKILPSRLIPPMTFRLPSVASTVIELRLVIVSKMPFLAVIVE